MFVIFSNHKLIRVGHTSRPDLFIITDTFLLSLILLYAHLSHDFYARINYLQQLNENLHQSPSSWKKISKESATITELLFWLEIVQSDKGCGKITRLALYKY
jgi:hypothetical protein